MPKVTQLLHSGTCTGSRFPDFSISRGPVWLWPEFNLGSSNKLGKQDHLWDHVYCGIKEPTWEERKPDRLTWLYGQRERRTPAMSPKSASQGTDCLAKHSGRSRHTKSGALCLCRVWHKRVVRNGPCESRAWCTSPRCGRRGRWR